LAGVSEATAGLVFARAFLQAHPHRAKGSLGEYVLKHIFRELVKKCDPRLGGGERGGVGGEMPVGGAKGYGVDVEDREVCLELAMAPEGLEKRCGDMSIGDLEAHNARIDSYLNFLTSYKEVRYSESVFTGQL
jgi:hypothetical protein